MRALTASLCVLLLGNSLMAQENLEILNTTNAKPVAHIAAYAIGYQIGQDMASNGLLPGDLSKDDILRGIWDALESKELAVSKEQLQAAMVEFSQKMQARAQEKLKAKSEEAKKFLEDNKKKEGVQVTQSGLQYRVIKSGDGATPTATSTVSVHYEGKLIDGRVFDSSIARGEPTSFPVNRVIPGWTEALQRMKVGDKWQLVIPPELAYKDNAPPGSIIGPNEVLIFEVELLEVK